MSNDAEIERSGVPGLSAIQIRKAMLDNGWGVLPILRHDAKEQGAGKRPKIKAWTVYATFDADLPSAAEVANWSRSGTEWQKPGTGVPCGSVVAIDIDFSADPAMAKELTELAERIFGFTPFVRQGRAPKILLVYRAAEAIPSQDFKTLSGDGDGLDILACSKQFVAFGIHRDTGNHYAWIGEETPLTAGPELAPVVTRGQVDDYIARAKILVPMTRGSGGRARKNGKGGDGTPVYDDNGKVIDGREGHLARCVWKSFNRLKDDGAEISSAVIANLAWAEFERTTDLSDGKWTMTDALSRASSTYRNFKRGKFDTLDPSEDMPPTYPDYRVPINQAEQAAADIIARFFADHVPAWQQQIVDHKVRKVEFEAGLSSLFGSADDASPVPVPKSWAVRLETGLGKTRVAIVQVAEAVRAGLRVVYAVPTHALGRDIVSRFADVGVVARVYHGFEREDPEASDGRLMCMDGAAYKDARSAGGRPHETVCNHSSGGKTLQCRFYGRCGMIRQRSATPDVWIVPHSLLFWTKPSFIDKPDCLVIDERFHGNAIGGSSGDDDTGNPRSMALDLLTNAPFVILNKDGGMASDASNDLETARANLARALRAHPVVGWVDRSLLLKFGVSVDGMTAAHKAEWRRKKVPEIYPGMDPQKRRSKVQEVAAHNGEVRKLAALFAGVRQFLEDGSPVSGRLRLCQDEKTGARMIERLPLKMVKEGWQVPALVLDATLPTDFVLSAALGHPVETKADIKAHWAPNRHVRQILGAPVSASKLGIKKGAEEDKKIVKDLLRHIRLQAACADGTVVVVAQKALIQKLIKANLPANVETGHFGAIAGLDRWKAAVGMIVIGRPLASPLEFEKQAGIFTGQPVESVVENCREFYPKVDAGLLLASGRSVKVTVYRHPDPLVEALRWQGCEGELVQAVGRLRALPGRRPGNRPFFLDIISDVVLPIPVDVVTTWDKVKPGIWAELVSEGVLLESEADIQLAYPDLASTRGQARQVSESVNDLWMAVSPIEVHIESTAIHKNVDFTKAYYKRNGKHSTARALVMPGFKGDVRHWLERKLGLLDFVRLSPEPEPAPGPSMETPVGHDFGADAFLVRATVGFGSVTP